MGVISSKHWKPRRAQDQAAMACSMTLCYLLLIPTTQPYVSAISLDNACSRPKNLFFWGQRHLKLVQIVTGTSRELVLQRSMSRVSGDKSASSWALLDHAAALPTVDFTCCLLDTSNHPHKGSPPRVLQNHQYRPLVIMDRSQLSTKRRASSPLHFRVKQDCPHLHRNIIIRYAWIYYSRRRPDGPWILLKSSAPSGNLTRTMCSPLPWPSRD